MKLHVRKASDPSRKNESIADVAAIEKIVTRLAELPVYCFKAEMTATELFTILTDFMTASGMDETKHLRVLCGDAMGAIELLETTPGFNSYGFERCHNFQLSVLFPIQSTLIKFDKRNDAVHNFMSITVKGYLNFLAQKAGIADTYEDFRTSILNDIEFAMLDNTTVREFLHAMQMYQSQLWAPIAPIKEYEQRMRRSYEDLYRFFITYFKAAFPEYFDLERMKEKYSFRA